jgi:flagellar hook assembly protein FlgD
MSINSVPILAVPPSSKTKAASTTSTPLASAQASDSTGLSQADFLKIMVAQFTAQDPLSSGDSSGGSSGTSDYVNELMSMTNLTTMQNISSQQSIQLAGTLPGSTVELSVNGQAVTGTVSGANITNGALYVTINGTQYPASELVAITQTQAQAQAAAAAAAAAAATTPATN